MKNIYFCFYIGMLITLWGCEDSQKYELTPVEYSGKFELFRINKVNGEVSQFMSNRKWEKINE